MHVNLRRSIALLFILAFLICTPLLLLYTTGYRYNFKKAQIQKTGALVVETEPKGANVLLNGNQARSNTPLRMNNVLPDEYEIKVAKDGYYPWIKKLSVKSQETIFAENIILFPETSPEKINDYEIKNLFFSPNHRYALFTTQEFSQDYLYLLNLNTRKEKLLYNNNKLFDNTNIIWSGDDSKVFFQLDNGPHVATTIFPQQKIQLEKSIRNMPTKLTNFRWDVNDSNILYGQVGNKIYSINFLTSSAESIFTLPATEVLLDYLVYQNEIYLIELLNNKPTLTKSSISDKFDANKSIELKHENYRFDNIYNGKMALFEESSKTLYLISLDLNKILFSKDNIQTMELNKKQNLLLLQTNQELSLLNLVLSELTEQTIARYSSGLTYSTWHHDSTNYILVLRDNKIYIIELDERDNRFIIELSAENVSDFRLNSDNDEIIFLQDNFLWELPVKK